MPFCLARLGSDESRSSKGWQKSLSGVLVREDPPCNWRSDGRSPIKIASCGKALPSIMRSISIACASLAAACSGSFPKKLCKITDLSDRMITRKKARFACHNSVGIVNTALTSSDGGKAEAYLQAAQGRGPQGQGTRIKLGNIPDNGQPQAGAWYGFVQSLAPFPHPVPVFGA